MIRQGDVALTMLSNASETSAEFTWTGGSGLFTVEGTFSGATIKLQFKSKNGTFIDAGSDVAFIANGAGNFLLPVGTIIKATVTGGPPSAVYAYAIPH